MDANNWRPAAPRGEALVEQVDWRAQLRADSRPRIVDKILETLKRRLPYSGPVGLQGLKEIAERFEAKIYAGASSQMDYLRKISLKMLTMENKSQNTIPHTVSANAASSSNRLPDIAAWHSLPSQVQNQPQAHQQLVSQNLQNNIPPGGLQSPTGLNTSLPSVSDNTQSSMTNVVGLDGNMQNVQSISQASASLDTAAESGQVNEGDWQKEAYQKVEQMRENYMPELTEMYQKIAAKLQQHDYMPQQPKSDQHDKLKKFKQLMERLFDVLQTLKSNICPGSKEKLVIYEKLIQSFLSINKPRKPVQQGLAQPHMQNLLQQQSQVSQLQSHENHHINPQMQSMILQGSAPTIPPNSMSSLQHSSLPAMSSVSASQLNMMNPLQKGSNVDSGQGNSLGSLQQAAVGSLQQISVSSSQQPSISFLSTQSGVSMLQPNIPMLSNSNMLQHQHLKQQQQKHQSQHLKQQFQQFMQQQQQQQHQIHHQSNQQLLAQLQAPGGVQSSTGFNTSLASVSGVTQRLITNVVGLDGNMQNVQSISQASNGNGIGEVVLSRVFSGSQRHMENVVLPQQQTQAQNSQYLCQQRQHLLKRKFQPENVSQTHMQYHIPFQQQIMLQPNPLQSTQQLVKISGVVQQSLIQPSMLQRHQQQSVGMQQQAAVIHQQQSQKTKQQRLMGEQVNVANMQQNQLVGLQNSTIGMQQQQQRLQLNDLQNLQQRQFQLQQQQFIAPQNNLPNMHQQQLDAQNIVVSQQQQQQHQLLRSQFGNSSLRTNQLSVHKLQQPMVPIQKQPQPSGTGLLAFQRQQSQLQAPQQPLMSQMQSSNTQLQHQLGLQQREQKMLQGPTQATGSLDPAAQSSQVNGGDWQEEGYQKVLRMTEKYLPELAKVLLQVTAKLREVAPQQPQSDQRVKLENDKQAAQCFLKVLQIPKTRLTPNYEERFVIFEKQIESFLATFGPRKPIQQGPAQPKEPLPSPSEPTVSCPICFGPMDRETTTKCGHVFCEKCIKAALAKKKRCPTCRRKVVARDLIRVYLGTNTSIPCFD